jgi:hypothetical protein
MKKENVLASMVVIVLMTTMALGDAVLTPGDPIIAIDADGITSNSNYPSYEGPAYILDGSPNTKYLNFGGGGSGFIVTPPAPALVQSVTPRRGNSTAQTTRLPVPTIVLDWMKTGFCSVRVYWTYPRRDLRSARL